MPIKINKSITTTKLIKEDDVASANEKAPAISDGVEVAMNDLRRMKHEEMIERLFEVVVNKYKDLKKNVDDNPHLKEVLKKYKKYIEDKINLYEAQLEVFHNILKYLKEEGRHNMNTSSDRKMVEKEYGEISKKLGTLRTLT